MSGDGLRPIPGMPAKCAGCGYRTEGLTTRQCPECGVDVIDEHDRVAYTNPPAHVTRVRAIGCACLFLALIPFLWFFFGFAALSWPLFLAVAVLGIFTAIAGIRYIPW